MTTPTLRITRPTNRLTEIVALYTLGLGMQVLGHFENHEGYDGAMIGHAHQAYHLEFTHEHGAANEAAPSAEHMLVFYEPDPDLWRERCAVMLHAGFVEVDAHNPYWVREGQTFRDIDGYLVVICRQGWDC
jgi:catechol 2,3-dioxygenase-like lactoylglutathione lyase family enzyme